MYPVSLRKISTIGNAALLLIINGTTTKENLISGAFLKLIKCSFFTISLCLINYSEKTLGVRNVGRIYGSWVNPYILITVCFSNKNQSPILLSSENCKNSFMTSKNMETCFGKIPCKIQPLKCSCIWRKSYWYHWSKPYLVAANFLHWRKGTSLLNETGIWNTLYCGNSPAESELSQLGIHQT